MLSIYRAGQANRAATNWREIGWLAAAVAAFVAADRWFDIPIFFSAPAAFLSAVVYGYFAHERSTRRRAELIAAATVAWNEAETAARSVHDAELERAHPDIIAARGEAYAGALDRSAIIAKQLSDYASLRGADEPKSG
jgi:hypothetical protein